MADLDLLDPGARIEEIRTLAGEHFISPEKINRTITLMEAEMKEAAKAMQFERAAEIRDRLRRVKILALGV
jgi:excinuclease ABC subunit B